MKLVTEKADKNSLAIIAKCYIDAFPNSISAKLGENYIKHNLGWFLEDEMKILFYIKEDNKCIGFCGGYLWTKIGDGSTSSMINYSKKIRNKILLSKPWLLLNFETIIKIFKFLIIKFKLTFLRNKSVEINLQRNESSLGLVVIGVNPNYKGKGIANLLIQQFEKFGADKDINWAHLSVRKENSRAINFYKKNGWEITSIGKSNEDTFSFKKQLK
jgi:ribosomal protein S18 acetylase RimI-like enzyme